MAPYRVLVVDDSAFMRKIISDLIVQDGGFTIAATASNGMEAIAAVREHQPDVITMDLEMPHMNGLEALQFIMKDNPRPIIMLSGISEDNTRDTIKALQFGAFDFIRKPSAIGSDDIRSVGDQLLEKLRTAAFVKTSKELVAQRKQASHSIAPPAISPIPKVEERSPLRAKAADSKSSAMSHTPDHAKEDSARTSLSMPKGGDDGNARLEAKLNKPAAETAARGTSLQPTAKSSKKPEPGKLGKPAIESLETKPASRLAHASSGTSTSAPLAKERAENAGRSKPIAAGRAGKTIATDSFRDIVAIGTSTGGPRALHEVICSLPHDFPAPVLIVQHMPPKFTKSLAQRLDSFSPLAVVEAEQGMKVKAGFVYVAPGGLHMELAQQDGGYAIRLGEQPQRNGHRPSVDVMFESLAPFRELNIHAVIMTGMGSDGAKGMKLLAEQGAASLIAESEETCIVYGMPRSAVEGGFVREILPLGQIASELVKAVNRKD